MEFTAALGMLSRLNYELPYGTVFVNALQWIFCIVYPGDFFFGAVINLS